VQGLADSSDTARHGTARHGRMPCRVTGLSARGDGLCVSVRPVQTFTIFGLGDCPVRSLLAAVDVAVPAHKATRPYRPEVPPSDVSTANVRCVK
jgi:hypothetical protein